MLYKKSVLIISLLFSIACTAVQIKLTGIDKHAVITGNTFRLQAEVQDPANQVKWVEFHASYRDDFGDNFNLRHHAGKVKGILPAPQTYYDVFIGKDEKPPFEIFWDVSKIPDQDGRLFSIWPLGITKGNDTLKGQTVRGMVLDRNPEYPALRYDCAYSNRRIKIDGDPSDWADVRALTVKCVDDSLKLNLLWNGKGLYACIRVSDRFIYNPYDSLPTRVTGSSAYWSDCIILCFDPRGNRASRMDGDDFPLVITPGGGIYNHGYLFHNRELTESLTEEMICQSRILGTINLQEDTDTGYVIELFLPKKLFGKSLFARNVMGFDISLIDRDGPKTFKNVNSWAGLYKRNRLNPTEWGSMFLLRKRLSMKKMIIIVIVLIGFLIMAFHKITQTKTG
jgi:hypothetical protein